MRHKIFIRKKDQTLYKGKMVNMPVKEEAIKEKSLELFDDDDPCIIHQSYVMKHFAQTLASLFETENTDTIQLKEHKHTLNFLDYNDDDITISLKR